jgi:hypothetical protein
MYKRGRISATELQESAAGVVHVAGNSSTISTADAQAWSRIGAAGAIRGNCSRDLLTHFRNKTSKPPLYEAKGWFWDSAAGCRVQDTMYIALPHEQLDWHIDEDNLQDFVARHKSHVAYDLVDAAADDWKKRVGLSYDTPVVGCSLWGDMAPFLNDELMLVPSALRPVATTNGFGSRYTQSGQHVVAAARAAAPWSQCLPSSNGQWRSRCTAGTHGVAKIMFLSPIQRSEEISYDTCGSSKNAV